MHLTRVGLDSIFWYLQYNVVFTYINIVVCLTARFSQCQPMTANVSSDFIFRISRFTNHGTV